MCFRAIVYAVFATFVSLSITTVAAAQSRTFVYTDNNLSGTISIYLLNPTTGAITPTSASPFQNGAPGYLAPARGGKFLVAVEGGGPEGSISTLSINPSNGGLKFVHAYEQIGSVLFQEGLQIATDVSGGTVYAQADETVTQGNEVLQEGVLDALQVDSNGTLTQIGSPFSYGINSLGGQLVVDPKGRWVFSVYQTTNQAGVSEQILVAVKRNRDGSLGGAAGKVNITDQKCANFSVLSSIAIDPQGKNLFLACEPKSGNNSAADFTGIQTYAIDQTTGALSRINSIATRTDFEPAVVDRQGWRVFAASDESNVVEVFDFNRNIRTLALLNGGITYKAGSQPNGVAVDPSNRFVYVTNGSFCFPAQVARGNCTDKSSRNISGYSFNFTKGTLTPLPGSPFPSGDGTSSMVFVTVP
jgi:6-phosphogluconolactonase (cycloisomerase 2 family)